MCIILLPSNISSRTTIYNVIKRVADYSSYIARTSKPSRPFISSEAVDDFLVELLVVKKDIYLNEL